MLELLPHNPTTTFNVEVLGVSVFAPTGINPSSSTTPRSGELPEFNRRKHIRDRKTIKRYAPKDKPEALKSDIENMLNM